MRLSPTRALLLLMAAVLAVLALVPIPTRTLLQSTLLDAAHVPAYGLFAWITLWRARRAPRWSRSGRRRPYLVALLLTVAVGTLTELSQVLDRRDASVADGARNLAGAGAALLLALALESWPRLTARRRRLARGVLATTAAALLLLSLRPVATVVRCYRQRQASFPQLCDFHARWQQAFLGLEHAAVRSVDAPASWQAHRGQRVARISMWAGATPALILREVQPDWTGYDRLVFEVFADSLRPHEVELRIDDIHHDNQYSDRFNRTLFIRPGATRFEIPLGDVEQAPRTRKLDLRHVRSLTLFLQQPARTYALHLDAFRLERNPR